MGGWRLSILSVPQPEKEGSPRMTAGEEKREPFPPMDTNLKLGSSTALSRQNVENIGSLCVLQEGTEAEAAAPHERPGEGPPLHVRVPRPPRVVRRRRLHRPRHRRRLRGRRQRTCKKDMLGLTFSRNQKNVDELLLVNDIVPEMSS